MRVINADQLRKACGQLRDELTDLPGAMIYPLALDVIARSPMIAEALIKKLQTVTPVGEP